MLHENSTGKTFFLNSLSKDYLDLTYEEFLILIFLSIKPLLMLWDIPFNSIFVKIKQIVVITFIQNFFSSFKTFSEKNPNSKIRIAVKCSGR